MLRQHGTAPLVQPQDRPRCQVSLAVGNAEQHDVQSLNMDLREFATQAPNLSP